MTDRMKDRTKDRTTDRLSSLDAGKHFQNCLRQDAEAKPTGMYARRVLKVFPCIQAADQNRKHWPNICKQ